MPQRTRAGQRGVLMVSMLVVIGFLALAVSAALSMVAAQTRQMGFERNGLQAFYLAEAGVERAFDALRQDPSWRTGFQAVSLGEGTYSTTADDTPEGYVLIRSTGDVRGDLRTVEVVAETQGTPRSFKRTR